MSQYADEDRQAAQEQREAACYCSENDPELCVSCGRRQDESLEQENRRLREAMQFVRGAVVLGLQSGGCKAVHNDPVVRCIDEALAGRVGVTAQMGAYVWHVFEENA